MRQECYLWALRVDEASRIFILSEFVQTFLHLVHACSEDGRKDFLLIANKREFLILFIQQLHCNFEVNDMAGIGSNELLQELTALTSTPVPERHVAVTWNIDNFRRLLYFATPIRGPITVAELPFQIVSNHKLSQPFRQVFKFSSLLFL